jgi:hypothetical protein
MTSWPDSAMIRSFPKNCWRKLEHGSPALQHREEALLLDETRLGEAKP